MKQLTPSISTRRSTGKARRTAASSHRVATNRATGLTENSSCDCAPPTDDVGRWVNDQTDSTRPSESDAALHRPAFYCAFSDSDTSRVPTGGNTGSTSDSGDRTRAGTRCRYAEPLPTNHLSSGGGGEIESPAPR